MSGGFFEGIGARSDAALQALLDHPEDYRVEAVEAAAAELARRGHPVDSTRLEASRQARRRQPRLLPFRRIPPRRLKRAAAIVLVLGLLAALWIYATAPGEGSASPFEPMDSKRYLRDMEAFGGKINVVATQLRLWFDGLWRGRTLASTVAALSAALAGLLRLAAAHPADPS